MEASQNQLRPPTGLTSSEPFVSAHGRSLVVVGLFVAYIVVTVMATVVNLMRLATPDMVIANDAEQGPLMLTEILQFLVALPTLLVYLALIVAFLVWLHRVAKNVPALGNAKSRIEYTPGWAVGSFFIPFANLYMPYRGVKEIWVKSDPAVRTEEDFMFASPSSAPTLLLGWWLMWIAHNILSNAVVRLQNRAGASEGETFVIVLDIVSDASGIIAAALAILVVRGIDRRQTERSRNVSHVSRNAPPPPLFTPPPPPPTFSTPTQS
jgi:hypothetical protein